MDNIILFFFFFFLDSNPILLVFTSLAQRSEAADDVAFQGVNSCL